MSAEKSYAQILKASSIMGGAAGINLLLGMVAVKFAAVLIGTTGVGLLASFGALQGLIGTLAGLGLQSSAVRDIAAAVAKGDEQATGRAVLALRRLSWLTGLVGMAAMVLLSPLLSQLTFGHRDHTLDIAALGLIILLGNLSGGQMALIQGMRRIGDMARANVYGAAAGTVAAIGFYTALGLRGIVPTLLAVSAIQLALSWHFARRVPVPQVALTWRQTFTEANGMVKLGLVMMWNGLMGSVVAYITILLITQHEGSQAVGLYSAAYALSGMFVNFVLGAMGTDYYPRLTGVATDNAAMVRIINEQTIIGLLITLPGLVATIAFSPWIIQIFYTSEFLDSVRLLQWFILGCLCRVISRPLSFAILAAGKGRLFLINDTISNTIHIALIITGLHFFGIEGVAVAFMLICLAYIMTAYVLCRHLMLFEWSFMCYRIAFTGLLAISATFIASRNLSLWSASTLGIVLTMLVSLVCLRQLSLILAPSHRIARLANQIMWKN